MTATPQDPFVQLQEILTKMAKQQEQELTSSPTINGGDSFYEVIKSLA